MKAFLASLLAIAAIAVAADWYLNERAGLSAAERASGASVRLD